MSLCLLRFIVFCILGLIASNNSYAQHYKFHHITTVDGLSHNEVRKIVKDSEGFLWFGTQNGLSRYDGYSFKVYKNSILDSTTIRGDKIYALEASSNIVWVGTMTGLSLINSKTGKVIDHDIPEIESLKLHATSINSIYAATDNTVCIASKTGNYIIDSENFSSEKILESYKIHSFESAANGNIWIGTEKGVLLYNINDYKILQLYKDTEGFEDLYTDKFGVLWGASYDGVFRFVPEKNRFIKMYGKHRVGAIAEANNGDMLFPSYGSGMLVYSREDETFYNLESNPNEHSSLSSNDLYDVFVDDEGLVWLGTQEGLDLYDWTRHRFEKLQHAPDDLNSLSNNFIQAIYKDKRNNFWFGTRDKGIDRVHFKGEDFKQPVFEHFYPNVKEEDALWGNYISDFHEDMKGRFWIATMGEGLNLYQRDENKFYHFTYNSSNSKSIISNQVASIFEDHKGRLWLGTLGGLSLMEESKDGGISFKNFYHDKYDNSSIGLNSVFKVFQDSDKRIWLGINNGGLNLVHEDTTGKISFERFIHDVNDQNSLSSNEVFVIFEDSNKRIWVGTSSAGLNLLIEEEGSETDKIKYSFKRYTEIEGLSDNEVNSILEDGDGKLWIATNKGFSHFDPENETFVNYTTYDGVLKGKFRKNAAYKNPDGTLFFGGAAGINFFNPDHFKRNQVAPKPYFISLFIDGKEVAPNQKVDNNVVLKDPLISGTTINLPSSYNRFEIQFTALSFASPLKNQFLYKLEGLDTDWLPITHGDLKVNYSDLEGGNYRFHLKAANNDGVWNKTPIYIDVNVASSFLAKVTSKLGYVFIIVFLGSIMYIVWYKNKNRSKKRTIQKERNSNSNIKEEYELLIKKLKACMTKEELFLNPTLSLQQLSNKLDVSSNQLSMILNDYVGKNFFDFINYYRVEEVKRRLVDPKYKNQTLLSISGECGFNSKSAFNRIFKNLTGKTPSQYQKDLQQS